MQVALSQFAKARDLFKIAGNLPREAGCLVAEAQLLLRLEDSSAALLKLNAARDIYVITGETFKIADIDIQLLDLNL